MATATVVYRATKCQPWIEEILEGILNETQDLELLVVAELGKVAAEIEKCFPDLRTVDPKLTEAEIMQEASGELVIFVAEDCRVLAPDWVSRMLLTFRDSPELMELHTEDGGIRAIRRKSGDGHSKRANVPHCFMQA